MAPKGPKLVAQNRRARHDYEILETVEAGIVLVGGEVKSLRDAKAQLADAFARVERSELWLEGVHIAPYANATGFGAYNPDRPRKLLVHRDEMEHLWQRVLQEHLTLIPLSMYFKDGRAKVELALARGRKRHDKRQALAERDAAAEMRRALGRSRKAGVGG